MVKNKIERVEKRERMFVPFERERIVKVISNAAANSGNSFQRDMEDLPEEIAKEFFKPYWGLREEEIAGRLADKVIEELNKDEDNLEPTKPPHVETIQDKIIGVLWESGFIGVAEMFMVYRSGKEKTRKIVAEGGIRKEDFAGHGVLEGRMARLERWNEKHYCDTVEHLNELVREPERFKELVKACIREYERELDGAVTGFLDKGARLLIVAGPSSSGKTTTTGKLFKKLKREGVPVRKIHADNYYWDLKLHPQDEYKDHNFERPESIDLSLLNEDLNKLLKGKTIVPPHYNYKKGIREKGEEELKLKKNEVLVLDNLYGFFPIMTKDIDEEEKFRLYIEAWTRLKEGDGTTERFVRHTDLRMLRRMVRDTRPPAEGGRGHPIEMTLGHWHYVRSGGELKDILPYIKTADWRVNGGLGFELPVLAFYLKGKFPDPELFREQGRIDAYIRGMRVKRLLESIIAQEDVSEEIIPADCLVREFIGGQRL